MKKNLEILEIEPKLTKDEKKYWRFKTSEGWMSCFDKIASEKLKEFKGKVACCEVVQSGDFSNIKKCYGEAEQITIDSSGARIDEEPEVVKIERPRNNHATMYVSYAKDISIGLTTGPNSHNTKLSVSELMEEAIKLVKQAKEAFED